MLSSSALCLESPGPREVKVEERDSNVLCKAGDKARPSLDVHCITGTYQKKYAGLREWVGSDEGPELLLGDLKAR